MVTIRTNCKEAASVLHNCNIARNTGCETEATESLINILQTVLLHNHYEKIVIEVTLSEKEEWQKRGGTIID